jgi:putative NADH-flavin reductase
MKILVLGARGKTGRLVVDRALADGHTVTALVHPHQDEKEDHPLPAPVEVIHGDAQNPSRMRTAMEGIEAVIDIIGGTKPFLTTDLETNTAKVVLDIMQEVGAKRLIAVSALGVGESKENTSFLYEHIFMPVFLRGIIEDKGNMEAVVQRSALDWIIVRPPILNDHDATGSIHVVAKGEEAHKITRADLARFLVDQLTSNEYVGQAITIANT